MAAAVNYYFIFFLIFYSLYIPVQSNLILTVLGKISVLISRFTCVLMLTHMKQNSVCISKLTRILILIKKNYSGINLKKYAPSYAWRVSKSRDAWDLVIYAWIFFNASSKFLNFSTRITLLGSRITKI